MAAMAAVTAGPAPHAFPPAEEAIAEASRRSLWAAGAAVAAAMLFAGGSWYALSSRRAVVSSPEATILSSRLPAQPPAGVKPESLTAQTPESIGSTPEPGSKVVVQASAEDAAVKEEQRRSRDEAERAAQAQHAQDGARALFEGARPEKVQDAGADRRLPPARETKVPQAEPDAQSRREIAAREAETNKADADAQQRREDAAWAAAAETARRPRQPEEPAAQAIEVPAGTEMDVRLSTKLNSGRVHVEDRFEATTLEER